MVLVVMGTDPDMLVWVCAGFVSVSEDDNNSKEVNTDDTVDDGIGDGSVGDGNTDKDVVANDDDMTSVVITRGTV